MLVLQVGKLALMADINQQMRTKTKSGDVAGNTSAPKVVSQLNPSSLLFSSTSKTSSHGPSLALYQMAKEWSCRVELEGRHSSSPMVRGTVQNSTSSLAAAFWNDHQASPLHYQGGNNQCPVFRALLWAYNNQDLPPTDKKSSSLNCCEPCSSPRELKLLPSGTPRQASS
jgi:hypothetical protein